MNFVTIANGVRTLVHDDWRARQLLLLYTYLYAYCVNELFKTRYVSNSYQ